MKLKRLLTLPVAMAADAVTMCNFGDRAYTQQVFDAERKEQENKQALELIGKVAEILSKQK